MLPTGGRQKSKIGACAHRRSACSEMPVDAASEMMAMSLLPSMKAFFSKRLTFFCATCASHTEGRGSANALQLSTLWSAPRAHDCDKLRILCL